ncbi:MAG: hypothetical protein R3B54_06230 [Bdellovibrionota bacterium]
MKMSLRLFAYVAILLSLNACGLLSLVGKPQGNASGYGGGDPHFVILDRVRVALLSALPNLAAERQSCRVPVGAKAPGGEGSQLWIGLQSLSAEQDAYCEAFFKSALGAAGDVLSRSVEDLFELYPGALLVDDTGASVKARTNRSADGKITILTSAIESLSDASLMALVAHEVLHKVVVLGNGMPGEHVHDESTYGPFASGRVFLDRVGARMSLEVLRWKPELGCPSPTQWDEGAQLCVDPSLPAVLRSKYLRFAFRSDFDFYLETDSASEINPIALGMEASGNFHTWPKSSALSWLGGFCSIRLDYEGADLLPSQMHWYGFVASYPSSAAPDFGAVTPDGKLRLWDAGTCVNRLPKKTLLLTGPDTQLIDPSLFSQFEIVGGRLGAYLSGEGKYYEWDLTSGKGTPDLRVWDGVPISASGQLISPLRLVHKSVVAHKYYVAGTNSLIQGYRWIGMLEGTNHYFIWHTTNGQFPTGVAVEEGTLNSAQSVPVLAAS